MPKAKGKGGKNRRRGKNDTGLKRELQLRDEGQEYAQVQKILGSGRVLCSCFDGEERLAHIRGKMRKKVWINQGDIVLVSIREFQPDKCDVILKYHPDEARALKAQGELPENTNIMETGKFGESDDECNVVFDFEGEDDDSDEEEDDLNIDDI